MLSLANDLKITLLQRYLGNYVHGLSKKPLSISVWKDPWLAYALMKNNPEYAAKVVL
ncbi:hypothetical protein Hanom_Chr17g01590811 [Helianthus anomalus]